MHIHATMRVLVDEAISGHIVLPKPVTVDWSHSQMAIFNTFFGEVPAESTRWPHPDMQTKAPMAQPRNAQGERLLTDCRLDPKFADSHSRWAQDRASPNVARESRLASEEHYQRQSTPLGPSGPGNVSLGVHASQQLYGRDQPMSGPKPSGHSTYSAEHAAFMAHREANKARDARWIRQAEQDFRDDPPMDSEASRRSSGLQGSDSGRYSGHHTDCSFNMNAREAQPYARVYTEDQDGYSACRDSSGRVQYQRYTVSLPGLPAES